MTVRRGFLSYKKLRAEEYKGGQPVFKGRIAVDRGSGVLEFPNPKQIERIAREEGVKIEFVRRAFGHMKGLKRNPGTDKRVRRGMLALGREWALEELPPSADPASLGARSDQRIMVKEDGALASLIDTGEAMKLALARGFSAKEYHRAFGHMKVVLAPGSAAPRTLDHYGPRRMSLGHWDPETGQVKGGVRRGSLVLYDKKSGRTPWTATLVLPPEKRAKLGDGTEKAINVRFRGSAHDLTFEQVFTGKGLRGPKRKELSIAARGIPPAAFLNAFAFLLSKTDRAALYREYG